MQTLAAITFLIWLTYLLVVPEREINWILVAVMIGLTLLFIGGITLLIMYTIPVAILYFLTK